MQGAGVSTQRKYDKLSARRRANRPRAILSTLVSAVLFALFFEVAFTTLIPRTGLDLLPGGLAGVWFAWWAWPREPQTTTAHAKGAQGEVRTAGVLDKLGTDFRFIHDRRVPGGRENIDHIVVGPTGVFVVETKNIGGKLRVNGGRLFSGRYCRDGYIAQAQRQARAVEEVLSAAAAPLPIEVVPLICVHGAELPSRRVSLQGVRLVGRRGLVRTISKAPTVLSTEQVTTIASKLDRDLRSA